MFWLLSQEPTSTYFWFSLTTDISVCPQIYLYRTQVIIQNFAYFRKLLRKHNPGPPLYTRYHNNFTADLKLLPSSSCPECDVTCLVRKLTEHSRPASLLRVSQLAAVVSPLAEQDKAFLSNEAKRKNLSLKMNLCLKIFSQK